jgi:hypothetical protein
MLRYAFLLSVILVTHPAAGQEGNDCAPARIGGFVLPGALREDVTLDYKGETLLLRFGGETGINIRGFNPLNVYTDIPGGLYLDNGVQFDDVVLCTREFLDGGFNLVGSNDAEIILGTNALDRIEGARGNDTLQGRNGDDVYLYELGDGVDCIADVEGTMTIAFGPGISPEDVVVAHDGNRGRYIRLLDQDGSVSAQGMNIRETPAASFSFRSGLTLSVFDFPPIEEIETGSPLRAGAHACHWETTDAIRAGLVDHRAETPKPSAPSR